MSGWIQATMQQNQFSSYNYLPQTAIALLSAISSAPLFLKIHLEKLRPVSNCRKISGPAHLDFFFSLLPGFMSSVWCKSSFFLGGDLEKNPGLQDLKFFYGLKQTLIFQELDFLKSRCRLKDRKVGNDA